MLESSAKPATRVSPRQLLLVGVLAVVLVAVLISQFGTADPGSTPPRPTTGSRVESHRPANARAPTGEQKAGTRRQPAEPDRPWPTYTLATVLEYDPFSAPPSLAAEPDNEAAGVQPDDAEAGQPEPAARKLAEREQALSEIRRAKVRAVVATEQGLVAIVGTELIRAGDRLHGFRVKEVRLDGVVLEDIDD